MSKGEISLPRCRSQTSLAVHVERDDLAGAEPRVDHLTVGHRARAREVVLVVDAGQRAGRLDPILPQPRAVGAVERFDDEERAIVGRPARAAASARSPLAASAPCASRGWLPARRSRRRSARSTKTRSPATIGDDTPTPPSGAFQATFSVALQRPADSFVGAPVPRGPRHCGQSAADSDAARAIANQQPRVLGFMPRV